MDFIAHLTSKERSEKPIGFMVLQKYNLNKLVKGINEGASIMYIQVNRGKRETRYERRKNAVNSGFFVQPETPTGSAGSLFGTIILCFWNSSSS